LGNAHAKITKVESVGKEKIVLIIYDLKGSLEDGDIKRK
jgi:hypothetical protein